MVIIKEILHTDYRSPDTLTPTHKQKHSHPISMRLWDIKEKHRDEFDKNTIYRNNKQSLIPMYCSGSQYQVRPIAFCLPLYAVCICTV